MVQSNMVLRPHYGHQEYIDVVPKQNIVKKKLFIDGEWTDRTFVRIPTFDHERDKLTGMGKIETWCREFYGNPQPQKTWWTVLGFIVLDEMVYTHWKLCE